MPLAFTARTQDLKIIITRLPMQDHICFQCFQVQWTPKSISPVQSESIWFYVDIPRAIVRVPGMVECPQLRLVCGHRRQEVRLERFLGQFPHAVHPPNIIVFIVQKPIPSFRHQRAVTQIAEVQVRKDAFKYMIRESIYDRFVHIFFSLSRI